MVTDCLISIPGSPLPGPGSIPISKAIIDIVNDMGHANGMTNVRFQTPHKKVIWDSSLIAGVDYIPFYQEDRDPLNPNEDLLEDDANDEEWTYEVDDEDIPLDYDDEIEEDEKVPISLEEDSDGTADTAEETDNESNQAEDPDQDQDKEGDEDYQAIADDEVNEEQVDEEEASEEDNADITGVAHELDAVLQQPEEEVIFEGRRT